MNDINFIAHPGQSLESHLIGVGNKTKQFAEKIGLAEQGEFIGLLHDFGKYSKQFQDYINSASGKLNPDLDEDYVDAKVLKGKIDHSTAGAQWLWAELKKYGGKGQGKLCGQILALCIASHHSGLIDCLKPDGENGFMKRTKKPDDATHLQECLQNADKEILQRIKQMADKPLIASMLNKIKAITQTNQHGQQIQSKIKMFYIGFFTRFLFSCLIDADRMDSAGRECSKEPPLWQVAIDRLEQKLSDFAVKKPIDSIRRKISDDCYAKASEAQGIYTLTVPTGGGKTYASLRYALHHARKHKLDRIIYIIPYTSIIEQNAEAIRKVIEDEMDDFPWVLEHHSNLEPEEQTWHSKLASENWDSPIVLTTMVQFLEVLFSGGTRSVRRLHQLANSVLIFDEIQTLPINCTHIFCNALNFLVEHAKTTAILCTATQPLLDELKASEKGQLFIPEGNELVKDVKQLFDDLERVEIINNCKVGGWNVVEISELALSELNNKGSCLVIVNTKVWAQDLYQLCKTKVPQESLFHLSTNQYPAHRKKLLNEIKARLEQKLPVFCISTQLIEAGVDIDFASVIRFLAGLDSIAQAAGRCNRNGELQDQHGHFIKGMVYVVNPDVENIDVLKDIKVGQETTRRVFGELTTGGLLTPDKIKLYFQYYFFERAKEMSYNLPAKEFWGGLTLLDLLSDNKKNSGFQECEENLPMLQQSFMTAGKAFKAIDAPTQAVIIQHDEGKALIAELCRSASAKDFNPKVYYDLLKKAQRYSVNVFPNVWEKLRQEKAVYEIQKDEGIFYLDERYYSEEFGLSTEPVAQMSCNIL